MTSKLQEYQRMSEEARTPAGRKMSAASCAAEDEIFDLWVWGVPQQAKIESSASWRNLFVLSLSDLEGIVCQRRVRFIKALDGCVL